MKVQDFILACLDKGYSISGDQKQFTVNGQKISYYRKLDGSGDYVIHETHPDTQKAFMLLGIAV